MVRFPFSLLLPNYFSSTALAAFLHDPTSIIRPDCVGNDKKYQTKIFFHLGTHKPASVHYLG